LPKNDDNEIFCYSIQTKVLRNENILIESFELLRIQNSLKYVRMGICWGNVMFSGNSNTFRWISLFG